MIISLVKVPEGVLRFKEVFYVNWLFFSQCQTIFLTIFIMIQAAILVFFDIISFQGAL